MKKLFWILLCLAGGLSVGLASAQTPPPGIHTGINTTWTAAGVACSSTVTKSCVQGNVETLTPPTGVTGGAVIVPACSPTVTTGCIGPLTSYLWKPGGNLYCGTWKISLVANWLSDTGLPVSSSAATVTAVEPCPFVASPPTGISSTPQ